MGTGNLITNNGHVIAINRTFNASPAYTAPTKFKVGTGTNTPTITDTDLQTAVIIAGGVTTKTFVTGYPTMDNTNFNATVRALLLTTDANSNSLTEFGLFNTDGSPLCFSRAVFTAISKTNTVQVIFTEKDTIE